MRTVGLVKRDFSQLGWLALHLGTSVMQPSISDRERWQGTSTKAAGALEEIPNKLRVEHKHKYPANTARTPSAEQGHPPRLARSEDSPAPAVCSHTAARPGCEERES